MDGSVQGNGNSNSAGFGGLIRNDAGTWLVDFSGSLGPTTILHAELRAIEFGLHLAWTKGIRRLICHSDSKVAVDLIDKGTSTYHRLAGLVFSIKKLLAIDWEVFLQHTLRKGNFALDWLAKEGCKGGLPVQVWDHPPAAMNSAFE